MYAGNPVAGPAQTRARAAYALKYQTPGAGAMYAMDAWSVVMIILSGVLALTLDRYDVFQRVLIWIAIGWFMLGALLLGYRCKHL